MLLNIVDPALLVYDEGDWASQAEHCISRLKALSLHRSMMRTYRQQLAMSTALQSLLSVCFPYTYYRELRDLREFLWADMERGLKVEPSVETTDVDIQPIGILCQFVVQSEIIRAWEVLLHACLNDHELTEYSPQIPTWDSDAVRGCSTPDTRICSAGSESTVPLVWNEDTWFNRLGTQDWWPDLHRCVAIHSRTNLAILQHEDYNEAAITFRCEPSFLDSLEQCVDQHLQQQLVAVLAKLVHGIHDAGLGLEKIAGREAYRFRVTGFRRVHFHYDSSGIVLEEFGPHRIDGVG